MTKGILGLIMASFAASAATPVARLSVGDPLPPLRGEFLTGSPALLPQAAAGRVALLLLGFTYDSRFPVEAWTKQFRHEFDRYPNVTFYEIPLIGGMARIGKWFIDRGMRQGTPKPDQGNVITVYGGTDPWKQRVGFSDPKAAYLILLDKSGKVGWQYGGGFDEERYRELSSQVARLLVGP
ncbi:MAG: hypothetical protein ABSH31_13370 [Bryobacteraceae bacterium]|jgi:hypothetical protein